MKLNEQATRELTASIFLIIAQEGINQEDALKSLGFNSEFGCRGTDFMYDSPCCEYIKVQGKKCTSTGLTQNRECAHICPLDSLWPNGCEHSTSLFTRWKFGNTITEKNHYAMRIARLVGGLTRTWSMELEEIK